MNKQEVKYEIKDVDGEVVEKGSVEIITENSKEPQMWIYDAEGNGVTRKLYTGLPNMNPDYFLQVCAECRVGKRCEYRDGQWKISIN